MAEAQMSDLPVIDFARLSQKDEKGNPTLLSVKERRLLFSALSETGFAYLKHPGVNQATVDQLFGHSKKFFAKPFEEKLKIKGSMDKGRGPSQGYSNPAKLANDPTTSDIKEFFGMYRDDDTEKPNQWLQDDESKAMRADLVHFFDSCHGVIAELLRSLAIEVGLAPETLLPSIEERNHFIACLFYPPTAADSFKMRTRAAAHTDYGCLTLLFNDSGEGLQVMRQNGRYEYAPRRDDCAVLNVGDLTSRFFNGILPSTMHRVVEPPATASGSTADVAGRYSLAFFGHYDLTTLVKPLDALVSPSNPAKFDPILAGEHVKARVQQLHLAGHSLRSSNGENLQSSEAISA